MFEVLITVYNTNAPIVIEPITPLLHVANKHINDEEKREAYERSKSSQKSIFQYVRSSSRVSNNSFRKNNR